MISCFVILYYGILLQRDDYNSNELEELRRKHNHTGNDSKSCSKSLEEHCRHLFVAVLVALAETRLKAAKRFERTPCST